MPKLLKHLPNAITASRIVFAVGFLFFLGWVDWKAIDVESPTPDQWEVTVQPERFKLLWAFAVFLIAGISDVIDGPLARAMNVTSKFGRSFDPLVDKILVGGGFIVLAFCPSNLTGLSWWMVIVIIGREALVTLMRQTSESQGKAFGATWAGKLKMFLQSFALGTIIMYVSYHHGETWAIIFRTVAVWVAVLFTAFSALVYLDRLKNLMKPAENQDPNSKMKV